MDIVKKHYKKYPIITPKEPGPKGHRKDEDEDEKTEKLMLRSPDPHGRCLHFEPQVRRGGD